MEIDSQSINQISEIKKFDNYKTKKIEYLVILSSIASNFKSDGLRGVKKDYENILKIAHCKELKKNYFLNSIIQLVIKKTFLLENQIREQIKYFFESNDSDSSLLFLTGKGNNNGEFILETKEGEKLLKYEEIAELWKNRNNKDKNKYLLIICEFGFSGWWVEKNTNSNNNSDEFGIYIQASCLKDQNSLDMSTTGGVLINNLCQSTLGNYEKLIIDNVDEYQNPTFSGSQMRVLNEFGLNLMFSSWKQFKNL